MLTNLHEVPVRPAFPRLPSQRSLERLVLGVAGEPDVSTIAAITDFVALLAADVLAVVTIERDIRWGNVLDSELERRGRATAESLLHRLEAASLPCQARVTLTSPGRSAQVIERFAEAYLADLVVVSESRGLSRLLRTGLAGSLLARGRVPVLMVPAVKPSTSGRARLRLL